MRLILVVLAAAALAWFTYWQLERIGPRAWLAALCRTVAWSALGILLLNLTCAAPAGPAARPLVLLDGSLSMAARGGQWAAARDSARAWGDVTLFGDARPASDTIPSFGRSSLAAALSAAAASDRPVIVVTDGEVDDVAELAPDAVARAGVRLFPRQPVADLAITRVRGPDRVTAGDTVRVEVEVRSFGAVGDSARVELRLDQRVLARRALRLRNDGVGSMILTFSSAGLSGDMLLTAALAGSGDAEPRDDSRQWLVRVSPTPGVVVIASPADWDGRFLLRRPARCRGAAGAGLYPDRAGTLALHGNAGSGEQRGGPPRRSEGRRAGPQGQRARPGAGDPGARSLALAEW